MQGRIGAAVDARRSDDFVIIARIDELWTPDGALGGGGGGGSLEETIKRSIAYAEAGADMLLPNLATPDQVRSIQQEVKIPIAYYGTPTTGVQLALYTGFAPAAMTRAFKELVTYIAEKGEYPPYQEWPDKDELIDQGVYDVAVHRWAERAGRPLSPS
jgi:2-methylisocitrate lyase-like PEP mutase family enzyme